MITRMFSGRLLRRRVVSALFLFTLFIGSADAQAVWRWDWLGRNAAYSPGAVAPGDGTVTAFIVNDTSTAIWYRRWNGASWDPWEWLGGEGRSAPSAIAPSHGQMTVFVRGTDNGVHYRKWLGGRTWANWTALGGNLAAGRGPSAVSLGDGRMAVFGARSDGAVWYRYFDGATWGPWEWLGGSCTEVKAISWGTGDMRVFGRCAPSASISYRVWQGGRSWSPWEIVTSNVAYFDVVSWGAPRIDIVANENTATPHPTKHLWYDGISWNSEMLPDPSYGVGITSPSPGVLDILFYNWQGNQLWHKRWNGQQWSSPVALPRETNGRPAVIGQNGSTRVFVQSPGPDYNLLHFQTP